MGDGICLFCGAPDGFPFIKKPNDDMAKRTGMEEWSLNCLESICSLFRIPNRHPVKKTVENCNCCAKCVGVVRDVDFTIRTLAQLLLRLEKLQQTLLDSLKGNCDRIDGSTSFDKLVQTVSDKFSTGSTDINDGIAKLKHLLNISKLQRETNTFQYHPQSADEEDVDSIIRSYSPGILEEFCIKVELEPLDNNDDDSEHAQDMKDPDSEGGDLPVADQQSDDDDSMDMTDEEDDSDYEHPTPKKVKKPTTSSEKLECSICSLQFTFENRLRAHIRRVHENGPKLYPCRLCPNTFGLLKSFQSHMRQKHKAPVSAEKPDKPYACDSCSKTFACAKNLKNHKLMIHNQSTHCCNYCNLNFTNLEDKELHEEQHNSMELPFQCVLCQAVLSNSISLKKHVASVHSSIYKICDVCGVKCSSDEALKQHRKIHSEAFVGFPCKVCGHVFRYQSTLDQHMHKHTNTKPYMCEICGKSYNYPSGLKVHLTTHEDETNFQFSCKVCEKKFPNKPRLTMHEEIHSGTLPYSCRVCQKKFKTRNNVHQHEKIHLPKNPNQSPRIRHRPKKEPPVEEPSFNQNPHPSSSEPKNESFVHYIY